MLSGQRFDRSHLVGGEREGAAGQVLLHVLGIGRPGQREHPDGLGEAEHDLGRRRAEARNNVYQDFSLLTANPEVLHHPLVGRIAARSQATPAQVVFRFSQAVGMLPLTGTTDPEHMKQDLASRALTLSADEVRAIESLAG